MYILDNLNKGEVKLLLLFREELPKENPVDIRKAIRYRSLCERIRYVEKIKNR